jgi:hypothetical protein
MCRKASPVCCNGTTALVYTPLRKVVCRAAA